MNTIEESRKFVLEKSIANIAFISANPANVNQGKQINAALANIVAMERNMIMHKALERSANPKDHNEGVHNLPES